MKDNPNKKHLYISKPYFNCNRDWAFIITSTYIPYADFSSGGIMNIYINGKWIIYKKLNLWLS